MILKCTHKIYKYTQKHTFYLNHTFFIIITFCLTSLSFVLKNATYSLTYFCGVQFDKYEVVFTLKDVFSSKLTMEVDFHDEHLFGQLVAYIS